LIDSSADLLGLLSYLLQESLLPYLLVSFFDLLQFGNFPDLLY
jgi:hypothetical protein